MRSGYFVFQLGADGVSWRIIGESDKTHPGSAIREVAAKHKGSEESDRYAAVAKSSWHPVTGKIEVQERLVLTA